jgi:hypothetical protein
LPYVKIEGRKYRPVLGYNLRADEAHRRAIDMITRIQRNLLTPSLPIRSDSQSPTTLREAIALYWDTMKVQGRVELDRPETIIQKHLLPFFGGTLLADLIAQDGLNYIKHRQGEGAAVGTIRREWFVLMRILNLAVDYDLLNKNRLKVVHIEKPDSRKRVATTEELLAIREAASPELWRTMLVALHTGLRESKILAIEDTWLESSG